MYNSGAIVAVRNVADSFWLCKVKDPNLRNGNMRVRYFDNGDHTACTYKLIKNEYATIPQDSFITEVKLGRICGTTKLKLQRSEKLRILAILEEVKLLLYCGIFMQQRCG